jgi:hypothetical protein
MFTFHGDEIIVLVALNNVINVFCCFDEYHLTTINKITKNKLLSHVHSYIMTDSDKLI